MPGKRDQSHSRLKRLSRASDFKRVFSRGRRIALPQFVIYVLANGQSHSRLGIQVRARIGTSVRRNYIKRIVREVFRKIEGDLRQGTDMIFIAEKAAVEMRYAELESGFRAALRRYLR